MFKFPENLYTDVRIENVYETNIIYQLGEIQESKTRSYKAAFIRVFDGERWYYSSTSDVESIQMEIEILARYGKPNGEIDKNQHVLNFQINKEELLNYKENSVSNITIGEKQDLIKSYFPLLESNNLIKFWRAVYTDKKVIKEFYSSKGSEIIFDTQLAGIAMTMNFIDGENRFMDAYQKASHNYHDLANLGHEVKAFINECERFVREAKPVKPGKYTVVLSPLAAGVFAHESFGHKSEADFMVSDETMKREWAIGKEVGASILSIIDDGTVYGSGYIPFDDEGTRASKTYIIKDGILNGRLHSVATATSLHEELTGNARAVSFEYEPIVRMTTTYIERGTKKKEELISEIKEGIYVYTINHGSGMSTFTIAPSLAYYIRDGKIAEPVNISVLSGNVMETLGEIDGVSDEVELLSFVTGGCGKMEQYPLPVGFGGPYVRVKNLNVQ
ncbi:TldD/PmbA family protein [Alkaliphilus transvaalensis]|uniref:TldD/PmbA family protein n=1 Tax=Alkaliphilus transvaalensis TaxID=114628 RepID=UPI00047E8474|nr:TldD/PmbA family protein [Alkaliphilus transvaalensis]